MSRIIGIRHQEKATVGGEMRPTQFYIISDPSSEAEELAFDPNSKHPKPQTIEFEDVLDELAWLTGTYVISYREVTRDEDVSIFGNNIKFSLRTEDDIIEGRHESQIKQKKGKQYLARKVPDKVDGVKSDDLYIGMMGGSGHQLSAGLATALETFRDNDVRNATGKVLQVAPIYMANTYGKDRDKDKDAERLIEFYQQRPELFHPVLLQDRKIARVKSAWSLRKAAQRARISHELRLRKVAIMKAYANPEQYVGAGLETSTLELINGDEDAIKLDADESAASRELLKAVEDTEVWQKVFSEVEGCGASIAGSLIAAISDIRRFKKPGQLCQYCGVAVVTKDAHGDPLKRATIQRRRSGEFSGWQVDARKGFWNFADQCNRRPGSVWGAHLLKLKEQIKALHPDIVEEENSSGKLVKRYTTGHIHKMAIWRLQTDFCCVIWRQWKRVHKYPGDLYYTMKKNDLRPPGNRNTEIVTEDLKDEAA